jgi:hypothetical protein
VVDVAAAAIVSVVVAVELEKVLSPV